MRAVSEHDVLIINFGDIRKGGLFVTFGMQTSGVVTNSDKLKKLRH